MSYRTDYTRLTTPAECAGRTVKAVVDENDMVGVSFEDKTYWYVRFACDDGSPYSVEPSPPPDPFVAAELGLIDEAEFQRALAACIAADKAEREAAERALLARLLARYPAAEGGKE